MPGLEVVELDKVHGLLQEPGRVQRRRDPRLVHPVRGAAAHIAAHVPARTAAATVEQSQSPAVRFNVHVLAERSLSMQIQLIFHLIFFLYLTLQAED